MLKTDLVYLPGGMLFAYFSIYYLLPRYFFQNRIPLYIILQLIVLIIYSVFSGFICIYIVSPYIFNETANLKLGDYVSMMFILILGMVPLAWARITKRMIQDNNLKRTLEKEKIEAQLKVNEAELKLLKAQIHPHFLFNTLNNLYSLAIQKSEKTPEVILKISDMLGYIIYDCVSEKVTLEKEIEFINSYIELERIRYDEGMTLSFIKSGDFSNKYIAPMILHAFVENSFKHGASKDTGNPWITIDLKMNREWLRFAVSNSKVPDKGPVSTGIGIENVKKRLNLLYPGRHSLKITADEKVHHVFLDIQL